MQWVRIRVRIRARVRARAKERVRVRVSVRVKVTVRVRVSVSCAFSEAFVGIAAVGIAACTRNVAKKKPLDFECNPDHTLLGLRFGMPLGVGQVITTN